MCLYLKKYCTTYKRDLERGITATGRKYLQTFTDP
jgi:hypothetical protein